MQRPAQIDEPARATVVSLSDRRLDEGLTALRGAALASVPGEPATLVVDLEGVRRLSSATVGTLLWAQRTCRTRGSRVRVRHPSRDAAKVLQRSGLSAVLDVDLGDQLAIAADGPLPMGRRPSRVGGWLVWADRRGSGGARAHRGDGVVCLEVFARTSAADGPATTPRWGASHATLHDDGDFEAACWAAPPAVLVSPDGSRRVCPDAGVGSQRTTVNRGDAVVLAGSVVLERCPGRVWMLAQHVEQGGGIASVSRQVTDLLDACGDGAALAVAVRAGR